MFKRLLILSLLIMLVLVIEAPLISAEENSEVCNPSAGCLSDSIFVIKVLNLRTSGNGYVTIQIEYINKSEEPFRINFHDALLVDADGNASTIWGGNIPEISIPKKGKRSVGLAFAFANDKDDEPVKLADIFHLTIKSTSPPGSVSFVDLKPSN